METAAEVVANAATRHAGQCLLDDLARPLQATFGVVHARQQELERRGMGKLGPATEPAVADVEQPRHLIRRRGYQLGAHRARLRFVERLVDVLADGARVGRDAIALFAKRARDLHQHAAKPRPAPGILVGREVRPAEEDLAVGREERRERPAALAAQRLHRALVARVHVRPFVAVDLDAHEVPIEDLGDTRVLIGLAIHDVTPVAPHRADIQQDRLLLDARSRERVVAPGQPVDRLMGGRLEIGGGF